MVRGGAAWRSACALGALAVLASWAPEARAIEAFDGRLQIHGFGEIQTRALAQGYEQDLDLAQWYNVLSVEIEADILPDGWGPFDLLSSYVRLEGRYDCVWTRGCGTMRSADAFGDRANKLPRRLADAQDEDFGGQIDANFATDPPGLPLRNPDRRVSPLGVFETVQNPICTGTQIPGQSPHFCTTNPGTPTVANRPTRQEVRKRKGFPGFDTLAELEGADAVLGDNTIQNSPNDDPFTYLFEPIEDFRWTFRDKRGPIGGTGRTMIMGPWLPKNFVKSLAVLSDRGNPFRGVRPPTGNGLVTIGAQRGPRMNEPFSYRWTQLDDQRRGFFTNPAIAPPLMVPFGFDPVDPRIARDTDGDGLFDAGQAFANLNDYPDSLVVRSLQNELLRVLPFGGDFTGIIPCEQPDVQPATNAQNQISGGNTAGCWTNIIDGMLPPPGTTRGLNIANTGGRGELPLRPAPDLSNLTEFQTARAQGAFYPTPGLRRALDEVGGDFDNHFFNFRQAERAWNRGYSQYYTKEFKEGYLDMEFLDSRLWIRLGKQNIVWGKTELFRTTDQFNPQDLALASLPSLEESRTALFAIRGVYSFYDIGPLQDVRLELAANFDHVTPADLGACGEPFTPDVVCGLTTGLEFHGLTGIGIAGVDRPPNPWDDAKGIEFGGRVEFRWDRFSVAIADFYGYNDFPHPDPIFFYERNVDTVSGRPLVAEGLRGAVNSGRCRNGVPVFARATLLTYPQGPNGPAVPSGANIFESGNPDAVIGPGTAPYWNALAPMMGGLGVGTDPGCLKPGGAPGGPNANLLDVANAVDLNADTIPDPIYNASFTGPRPSPENALEFHYANQQIFSFLCLGTVTIAASVDGSSCAWTVFGSPNQLVGAPPTGPGTILSETFSATFAGESSNAIVGNLGLLSIIQTNQKSAAELPVPLQAMNRDLRDGVNTSLGLIFRNVPIGNPERAYTPDSVFNLLSLDSVMTAEQRALLGCGPFFGTRCDSSRLDRAALAGFPAGSGVGFPEGGGIDFLNTEASALTQSFPGIPGTEDGWTTTSRTLREDDDPLTEMMIQPGTIGFENEAYCTRYDPKNDLANDLGLVRLPGCRGIVQRLTEDLAALAPGEEIEFLFEPGYTPQVDGCVLGVSNPNDPASRGVAINDHPVRALRIRPRNDPNFDPNDPVGSAEDITLLLDATCGGEAGGVVASSTRIGVPGRASASLFRSFAQTAWHPLAGCKTWAQAHDPSDAVRRCNFSTRNFEQEYFAGTAQIFRNEMAVFSWNFLQFLVIASCDSARGGDDLNDPDCFDPRPATFDGMGNLIAGNAAWAPDRCSLAAPQYCRNVKGFLSVAGLQRNDVRAGGTTRFGRLDFVWHSGGELVLEYARRNVFGFSADFAEDVTKTNWGMEFTWFTDVPFVNNDDFYNVSDSQILNLTVSVDRPTFINFLNANRTFFINSQWFFQYLTDYQGGGFTSNGPFNVLFTVAVFTGYFQDRLNPQWVFVYDFGSRSGGLLPSLGYRFTENFSATIGFNYFFGRGQLKSMPVRGFAPAISRAGENRYRDGVENVLALIRHRDEVFFRLRYTF
jgi:hypothetical protein